MAKPADKSKTAKADPSAEVDRSEEAAAKPQRAKRFQRQEESAADVVRRYFDAVERKDLDGLVACWAPGGLERIAAVGELRAPDEVRAFFGELFTAVPDGRFEILDFISEGTQVAVRWRSVGTFCGAPFQGIEPTGARTEVEGLDLLTVEDGLIQRNDAYYDGMQFARQIGLLPPKDSPTERRMTAAFNARTRLSARLFSPTTEPVADGVWLIRGGFPRKTMNVYLIEDGGKVTVFDAGIQAMTRGVASAAAKMGGIARIVLGHGHADHRGVAAGLDAPVFCHADEVADAESDGGYHYFDFSRLDHWYARALMPRLLRIWDGGPVKVEGTIAEGDDVAGFEVVHFPGHAPGLIGLWRKSDRLALVSDTLYTLDPETGRHGPPRVPHAAFNRNTEQARASILKLAKLEPALVWPGHADPVRGDVREQLERAANSS